METRAKRKLSIRKKLNGTADRPRVTVYRSNYYIYAQAVDDTSKKTLASAKSAKGANVSSSEKVGEDLGKKLAKLKVKSAVFDRNGYRYHGKVMAVADGVRKAGIQI